MRRTRAALILPSLLLGACDFRDFDSSDRYQSDFHYSYALNPGGRLEVENFNGAVEITGWDQGQCEVTGAKYANTAELRDRIKIEVNHSGRLTDRISTAAAAGCSHHPLVLVTVGRAVRAASA